MDLKGRELVDVLRDGARLKVWYVEESGRTCYHGTVTDYGGGATHGLRVWFDGYPAEEQEWVNGSDEWEWDTDTRLAADASTDHTAVRLKLKGGQTKSIALLQRLPRPAGTKAKGGRNKSPTSATKLSKAASGRSAKGAAVEGAAAAAGAAAAGAGAGALGGGGAGAAVVAARPPVRFLPPKLVDGPGGIRLHLPLELEPVL